MRLLYVAASQQPVVDRYRHPSTRLVVNDLCVQRRIPNPYRHDSFRSSTRFRACVSADFRISFRPAQSA